MTRGAKLVSDGGTEFLLTKGVSTIGRPDHASGWIPTVDLSALDADRKTSRRHAEIRAEGASHVVKDLDAANRTFLNGQPLQPNTDYPLSEGDVVTFGMVPLRIVGIAAAETGLRCPKCVETVTPDMATCASCGANLRNETMTISVGAASACFRCGRPTRSGEHCAECAAAVADADSELLALSGLKRKK